MIRPKSYPELLGKALVLEAEPFASMVDDDEPWVEGLFVVLTLGIAVGIAQFVGGLLLTASLPPAPAVLETLINGWQQFAAQMNSTADLAVVEANMRQAWYSLSLATGYGAGWASLWSLISVPLTLLIQWLLAGLLVFAAARALGGNGTLNQTLGATALMVAPDALLLLKVIPFVSVSGLLLLVWGTLILYRAAQVTHELSWQRAILAALAPLLLLVIVALVGLVLLSIGLWVGGMA